MNADPIKQFALWFTDAQKAKEPLPESMAMATVDGDGKPSVRILLLKAFSKKGFTFFTNDQSRKCEDMLENPHVALTFHWPRLQRQVRIEGLVKKVTRRESMAYFATRPRGSQIGAWASPQSTAIHGRELLDEQVEFFTKKFAKKPVPCPPHWGGYLVAPERIEFWQGKEDRLHDRFLYLKDGKKWAQVLLAP